MKTKQQYRVTRDDIFNHLDRFFGKDGQLVVNQIAVLITDGKVDQGLIVLKSFDAEIGGIGLHKMKGEKLPGAFRAISYVEFSMRAPNVTELGRQIIQVTCEHIESILKRMTRQGVFNLVRFDDIPMGALLRKVKKRLPQPLYVDLLWLTDIYNSAKHEHDFSDMDQEPDHFFELDEGIAIYFIARKLAVRLIELSKKSQVELEMEE